METQDPRPAPPPAFSSVPPAASTYAKADLVKRFVAVLIDGIISTVIAFVLGIGGTTLFGLGLLVGAAYILVRDGLELDFADRRSIGKKIMKLRPVRLDGGVMDINASIRRNWTLALATVLSGLASLTGGLALWAVAGLFVWLYRLAGLLNLAEGILVITDKDGRRIGDKMAETQVIESEA